MFRADVIYEYSVVAVAANMSTLWNRREQRRPSQPNSNVSETEARRRKAMGTRISRRKQSVADDQRIRSDYRAGQDDMSVPPHNQTCTYGMDSAEGYIKRPQ